MLISSSDKKRLTWIFVWRNTDEDEEESNETLDWNFCLAKLGTKGEGMRNFYLGNTGKEDQSKVVPSRQQLR